MRHNEAVEKLDLSFFRDRNSLFLIKLNFLKFVFMGFFYSLNARTHMCAIFAHHRGVPCYVMSFSFFLQNSIASLANSKA